MQATELPLHSRLFVVCGRSVEVSRCGASRRPVERQAVLKLGWCSGAGGHAEGGVPAIWHRREHKADQGKRR